MSRRLKKPKPKAAKALQFSLTPQGFLIKISGNPEKIQAFDQQIVNYASQLQSMDADYAYAIALKKIQVVLDGASLPNRRPVSCKAGCSACCHQKVDVAPFEGTLLMRHVIEQEIPFDRKRLDVQVAALQQGSYEQLPFADRQCIFLKDDKTCAVYSVRPLMCRRHFVQSDPSICRSEDFTQIELDVNIDVDAYLSAYVTRNATLSLPLVVKGEAEPKKD